MQGSKYSAEVKAGALAILAACRGNLTEAAQKADIPVNTLGDWANENHGVDDTVRELRDIKKRDLADMSEDLARAVWGDLIDPDKRKGASYGHLNAAYGTAIDKAQLLRGKATQIIDDSGRIEAAVARVMQITGCDLVIAQEAVRAQPEFKELGRID